MLFFLQALTWLCPLFERVRGNYTPEKRCLFSSLSVPVHGRKMCGLHALSTAHAATTCGQSRPQLVHQIGSFYGGHELVQKPLTHVFSVAHRYLCFLPSNNLAKPQPLEKPNFRITGCFLLTLLRLSHRSLVSTTIWRTTPLIRARIAPRLQMVFPLIRRRASSVTHA